MILDSPPFVLDAPGRVGNLLAADLHRSIGLSAAPPSSWSIIVWKFQKAELFNFQGAAWPLVKNPFTINRKRELKQRVFHKIFIFLFPTIPTWLA